MWADLGKNMGEKFSSCITKEIELYYFSGVEKSSIFFFDGRRAVGGGDRDGVECYDTHFLKKKHTTKKRKKDGFRV